MSKWEKIRLGDVCEIHIGKTPSRDNINYWHDGTYHWLSIADMKSKYLEVTKEKITNQAVVECNMNLIPTKTVVMSFKLSVGKVGITSNPMYSNEAIAQLPIKNKNILCSDFLFYNLKNLKFDNLDRAAKGLTLNKKKLYDLKIHLPPLEVQRQIAHDLNTVSELIALRKSQLEELDGLIKSMFYNMFGDPVLNNMDWATQSMLNVGKFISGGTPSKERNDYWEGNFPWVSPKDMKVPYISKSQNHISNNVFEETSLKKIAPGHILIVVRGMILAHSFPTAINTVEVSINQDMKAILPNEAFNVVYLKQCLDNMKHQIVKLITTAGHGTKKFDVDSMRKVFIPVPPLSVQKHFATIVTKIEEQKTLVKQSIEETQTLFDSLMSQYFD